ncbi:hypothetical protein JCM11491_006274 [Sporobolomyces phaffii]
MEASLPALPVAKNGNLRDSSSLAPAPADPLHLERELPTVTTDLVPLSYLIDRLVTQSYSDLSTLIETLPSHSDQQRKQLLVDYVLHTRRQFLKLLVLTRWSAESDRIRKSINIIGFLSNQNHQLDASITRLAETVEGLKGARVRNYDLETSLDVLQKGTYDGLPSGIREAFEGQEKLQDDQVLDTMRECEHVMRWRLKMGKEELPKLMSDNYRIADGRVTFRIEGLWEASFVYSGTETQDPPNEDDSTSISDEDQSEWYLLGIKFLFTVKDERGGNWNPTPTGPLKQHLVDLCNGQLARRPFLPAPPPPPPPVPSQPVEPAEGDAVTSQETEQDKASEVEAKYASELKEARAKRRRDQPLQRGYTFLQRLALSYQLESVYSQAVQLIRSDWNACGLRVEINGERDQVTLKYWNDTEDPSKSTNSNQLQSKPLSAAPASGTGGTLIFSLSPLSPASNELPTAPVVPPPSTRASTSRALDTARSTATRRRRALESLLAKSQSRSDSASASTPSSNLPSAQSAPRPSPPEYPPVALQITYLSADPHSSSSSSSYASSASPAFALSPIRYDLSLEQHEGESIDLEAILTRVTNQHAQVTVEAIARELVAAARVNADAPQSCEVVVPKTSPNRRQTERSKGKRRADGMEDQVDGEGEENEASDDDERSGSGEVPHVFVPLVGPHAVTVHIDPKSGRFELRNASSASTETVASTTEANATATGDGESTSRETRLRTASDRVNSARFAGDAAAETWIKGLPEVIAKIRATTILDEISTLFTLLSLPTLRRLPLPPRELSKFGPLPSLALGRPTFLFVPLDAHVKGQGLEGFHLSIVSIDDGIRMGLVGTRECTDASSGSTWIEITEVGWLYADSLNATKEKKKKGREGEVHGVEDRGSNFGYQVSAETLRKVWNYCVHRTLTYRLEQQLYSRQIPYRSSSESSSRLSIDLEPPPYLVLDTENLIKLPRAGVPASAKKTGNQSLVRGSAALRCHVDEETNTIRTTLHLRLNPTLPTASLPRPFTSTTEDVVATPLATLPRNVFYNPSTRALVFLTENEVLESVERLLRAYAGVLMELQDGMDRTTRSREEGEGKEVART